MKNEQKKNQKKNIKRKFLENLWEKFNFKYTNTEAEEDWEPKINLEI